MIKNNISATIARKGLKEKGKIVEGGLKLEIDVPMDRTIFMTQKTEDVFTAKPVMCLYLDIMRVNL